MHQSLLWVYVIRHASLMSHIPFTPQGGHDGSRTPGRLATPLIDRRAAHCLDRSDIISGHGPACFTYIIIRWAGGS